MVLGLSLTSEDIVWVLVDETDGAVADHDYVEFNADAEIAGAAACGAHAIATACGFAVDRIRITCSDDVARDGLRLRSRLTSLGFDNVEAVPRNCAGTVLVDPDMEPALALAYGAALARVSLSDAITAAVSTRAKPRRTRRGRMALAVLGAAAAAVGGLLLTSGSLPQAEQTATAAEQPTAADNGWVAVSAPSESAARAVRKVVDTPKEEPAAYVAPVVETVPLVAVPTEAVAAAPPVTLPPMGTPHLQAPESLPTAQPHLVDAQPALGPAPEMTDLPNLFTALP
jgi:hypothetical protein